jgi:hypothetical protein
MFMLPESEHSLLRQNVLLVALAVSLSRLHRICALETSTSQWESVMMDRQDAIAILVDVRSLEFLQLMLLRALVRWVEDDDAASNFLSVELMTTLFQLNNVLVELWRVVAMDYYLWCYLQLENLVLNLLAVAGCIVEEFVESLVCELGYLMEDIVVVVVVGLMLLMEAVVVANHFFCWFFNVKF